MIYRRYVPGGIPYHPTEGQEVLDKRVRDALRAQRPIMVLPSSTPHLLTPGMLGEEFCLPTILAGVDGTGELTIVHTPVRRVTSGGQSIYLPDKTAACVERVALPGSKKFRLLWRQSPGDELFYVVEILFYSPEIPRLHPQFPFSRS